MYNFESKLFNGEKILYTGQPVPGKGHKNFLLLLSALIILICVFILLIVQMFEQGISLNSLVIILVILLFIGLLGYSLIYNLFIKSKAVADDYYCITNQRVLKYESKTDTLRYGYLGNYEEIIATNIKDNYGDVKMEMIYNQGDSNLTQEQLVELKDLLLHPNPENMPSMLFESIENPIQVANIVKKAKEDLQKNSS